MCTKVGVIMTLRTTGQRLAVGESHTDDQDDVDEGGFLTSQAPVPLLLSQLSIVLSSLCHGVTVAAHHHCTSPTTIRSWIQQQQRGLRHRMWSWKTEEMAEWVLERWEQQQIVSEELLLLAARAALGGDGRPEDWCSWTVDFMLRHDLGPQTTNRNVPNSLNDKSRCFIDTLRSQVSGPKVY